ncbi:hypothetical protein BDP27DRAFT_1445147 [Rhodocollybia butyracea]|uniref:Uncharacterized protein n=1 Tax=Rhodocollybia butyracea TaxID=206335 RepID=A0A9P5UCJ1_9AGAR|nr:hypothetical protein BDP27DRAFT_1445147 [Rhodocollybia butyracea]
MSMDCSTPPERTLLPDDVLGALHNAGANGKISTLGRKAAEIYFASEAAQAQRHKEALKHLSSVACKLVYAILKANDEISLQDGTLNHVENLLNRVLNSIRTIQRLSSTSMVYRSLLRRKNHSIFEAQLQTYTDQIYYMLFHFQVSQRVNALESRVKGKKHGIFLDDDSHPSSSLSVSPPKSNPSISSVPGTSDHIEHLRSDPLASTPSNPVRRKSNNPFLPLIESGGFPRDASLHVTPFAPPIATDISLRASHVGGSSSTVSQVDNSTKKNYNNVINNVTHNVTANFNGNIFMPAFPALGYHASPGLWGADNSGYVGYNVHGGNGGYTNGNGAHNGNSGGNGESSTNDGLNGYLDYFP